MFKQTTRHLGDDWLLRNSGLMVPPSMAQQPKRPPQAMDLFCGAGGMSLGIVQAGIQVVAGMDNDEAAIMTYAYNLGAHPLKFHFADDEAEARLEKYLEKHAVVKDKHGIRVLTSGSGWRAAQEPPLVPGVEHVFFGDVRKFTPTRIMDVLGIKPGELHLMVGGPPCQGFSQSGKRDIMDPRNSLVFEFARFVAEIKPLYMVMENVPGIASMVTPEGAPVLDVFCQMLADGGYSSYEAIKKALTYNLPKTARVAVHKKQKPGTAKNANGTQARLALDF